MISSALSLSVSTPFFQALSRYRHARHSQLTPARALLSPFRSPWLSPLHYELHGSRCAHATLTLWNRNDYLGIAGIGSLWVPLAAAMSFLTRKVVRRQLGTLFCSTPVKITSSKTPPTLRSTRSPSHNTRILLFAFRDKLSGNIPRTIVG
jgi:hypothetical protein